MDFFFILDLIVKNKEEELNLIIVELRKSLASLQEKLSKEESEKLVRKSDENFGILHRYDTDLLIIFHVSSSFLDSPGCNGFSCKRERG